LIPLSCEKREAKYNDKRHKKIVIKITNQELLNRKEEFNFLIAWLRILLRISQSKKGSEFDMLKIIKEVALCNQCGKDKRIVKTFSPMQSTEWKGKNNLNAGSLF
jgi:hypothetical protein